MGINTKQSSLIFLVTLFVFSSINSSEIYTWSDEHGHKNFSDSVPDSYQHLEIILITTSEPSEENINRAKKIDDKIRKAGQDIHKSNRRFATHVQDAKKYGEAQGSTDRICSNKKKNYKKSMECLERCKLNTPKREKGFKDKIEARM